MAQKKTPSDSPPMGSKPASGRSNPQKQETGGRRAASGNSANTPSKKQRTSQAHSGRGNAGVGRTLSAETATPAGNARNGDVPRVPSTGLLVSERVADRFGTGVDERDTKPLGTAVIREFDEVRGRVRIEHDHRVDMYVRERRPEETTILADYIRAREAFSSDRLLAQSLGVSLSRLAAWKGAQGVPTTDEARMLAHLAIVVRELANALHPDSFYGWLITEQFTLDMRTPLDALREGHLADVLQAVNAAEHLAYI